MEAGVASGFGLAHYMGTVVGGEDGGGMRGGWSGEVEEKEEGMIEEG